MAAVGEGEDASSAKQMQALLSGFIASQSQQLVDVGDQVVVQGNVELDKELFLQALRDFKCLWDTSDANYKNRTMKLNAWGSLAQMFNQEGKYDISSVIII